MWKIYQSEKRKVIGQTTQVPMVVQELVASDPEMQEALADTFEVVQEIAQARPHAFHRVTVHTRAVGVTTSILARAMVDRPMVIVDPSEMVDVGGTGVIGGKFTVRCN